jgi:spore germination protein YaaH
MSFIHNAALAATAFAALTASPVVQGDLPPTHYRGSLLVGGWLPYWTDLDGGGIGWKTVQNNSDLLDDVTFFAWDADPATGALTPPPKGMSDVSLLRQVAWLHNQDVAAIFTVTQFNHVHDLLASDAAQNALVDNIVHTAQRYSFDGVDIDFEQFGDARDQDSPRFTAFIDRLSKRMHKETDGNGFPKLSIVTILARTTRGKFQYADEEALAKTDVDRVRVMAYDDYFRSSKTIGACAPLDWTEKVISYYDALNAPVHKFILGIPGYAYRWPVKDEKSSNTIGEGATVTFPMAQSLMSANGAKRIWDKTSQTPSFRYFDHVTETYWAAYFEDAQSWDAKISDGLIPSNFGGLCEWALGFEDPASWVVVSRRLTTAYPISGAIGQCYARYGGGGYFGAPLGAIEPFGDEDKTLPYDHKAIRQEFEHGVIEYHWGDWHAVVKDEKNE